MFKFMNILIGLLPNKVALIYVLVNSSTTYYNCVLRFSKRDVNLIDKQYNVEHITVDMNFKQD